MLKWLKINWGWIKSERWLIVAFTIVGLVVGAIYAHDQTFLSIKWFEKLLNGLAVVSILSGAYIRYVAAVSREKSGQTTKRIEEVLKETSNKMVYNFRKITFDSEIKHYRSMLGPERTELPNIWHFKLRFESEDRLHIDVLDRTVGSERTDSCIIKIKGYTEENHGGFLNRYYIAEIEQVLVSSNTAAPIFENGQVVSCTWLGDGQKISLAVTDMPGGPAPVFSFTITGVPGHVTFLGTPAMADTVEPTPRLFDQIKNQV